MNTKSSVIICKKTMQKSRVLDTPRVKFDSLAKFNHSTKGSRQVVGVCDSDKYLAKKMPHKFCTVPVY